MRCKNLISAFSAGLFSLAATTMTATVARADAVDIDGSFTITAVGPNVWNDVAITLDQGLKCPGRPGTDKVRSVGLDDETLTPATLDRMMSTALAAMLSGRPVKLRLEWKPATGICAVSRLVITK
jgi:hypothetical protein